MEKNPEVTLKGTPSRKFSKSTVVADGIATPMPPLSVGEDSPAKVTFTLISSLARNASMVAVPVPVPVAVMKVLIAASKTYSVNEAW